MTVNLVSVPDVEIVSTGTYQLDSGEATFSAENLADAVAAYQDPTVTAPRLKIGHSDPRFAEAVASGELDGEPAFGVLANLRLSDDAQTILADFTNVPEWLAEVLPSSYPGRSIEGGFGFTASSGKKYSFVISACALLGVTLPGVGTLEDLQQVLTSNGLADAAEPAEMELITARIRRTADQLDVSAAAGEILAGMDIGDVRNQFYMAAESAQISGPEGVASPMWWWVRSMRLEDDGSLNLIVDDDEGHLMQIPFSVTGQNANFGDPSLVMEQYVPVAAAAVSPPREVARWGVRAATRPENQQETHTMLINGIEVDAAPLRTRLGLADDVEDAAIYEALGITAAGAPEVVAPVEVPEVVEPVAAAVTLPDGMVMIDQDMLAELQGGVQVARELAASNARTRRDQMITDAVTAGKIPVAARAKWSTRFDNDPEGTTVLLTASDKEGGLAAGLIPVRRAEIGQMGDGDVSAAATADGAHAAFMAAHFPSETNRLRARADGHTASRVRVRTEA